MLRSGERSPAEQTEGEAQGDEGGVLAVRPPGAAPPALRAAHDARAYPLLVHAAELAPAKTPPL